MPFGDFQHLEGLYSLHLFIFKGEVFQDPGLLHRWIWRCYDLSKIREPVAERHSVS